MNKNVPTAAQYILELIGSVEAPRGYDTFYNNKKWAKPVTHCTVDELITSGRERKNQFGSSACGRYQFMADTLRQIKKDLNLKGTEVMTPDFQDDLGWHLLIKRGFNSWLKGEHSTDRFMIGLAQEWASFPVPQDMQGQHREVKRGETYYAGDRLNKSLINPGPLWTYLENVKTHKEDADMNPALIGVGVNVLLNQVLPRILQENGVPRERAVEIAAEAKKEAIVRSDIPTPKSPFSSVGMWGSVLTVIIGGVGAYMGVDQESQTAIVTGIGTLITGLVSAWGRYNAKVALK